MTFAARVLFLLLFLLDRRQSSYSNFSSLVLLFDLVLSFCFCNHRNRRRLFCFHHHSILSRRKKKKKKRYHPSSSFGGVVFATANRLPRHHRPFANSFSLVSTTSIPVVSPWFRARLKRASAWFLSSSSSLFSSARARRRRPSATSFFSAYTLSSSSSSSFAFCLVCLFVCPFLCLVFFPKKNYQKKGKGKNQDRFWTDREKRETTTTLTRVENDDDDFPRGHFFFENACPSSSSNLLYLIAPFCKRLLLPVSSFFCARCHCNCFYCNC